ncbi:unnamed protein product, partial [Sphacelaria rigidula]
MLASVPFRRQVERARPYLTGPKACVSRHALRGWRAFAELTDAITGRTKPKVVAQDNTGGLVIGRAVVKSGGGVPLGGSNAVDPSEAMDGLFGAFNRYVHNRKQQQDAQEFLAYTVNELKDQIAGASTCSTDGGAAPEETGKEGGAG